MGDINKEEQSDHIIKYMKLDYSIRRLQKRIDNMQSVFFDRSFHTRIEPTDLGLNVLAYRIESEVCGYVDSVSRIYKKLENKKRIRKYFNDYLNSLSPRERDYLYKRYLMGYDLPEQEEIDNATIEEIREIEEAISYMNGEEPDKLLFIENTEALDFEKLLEVLDL